MNSPWITVITEGKIEGKPGRRKDRTSFLKQVMEDTGIGMYWELKRNIGNREQWRATSFII